MIKTNKKTSSRYDKNQLWEIFYIFLEKLFVHLSATTLRQTWNHWSGWGEARWQQRKGQRFYSKLKWCILPNTGSLQRFKFLEWWLLFTNKNNAAIIIPANHKKCTKGRESNSSACRTQGLSIRVGESTAHDGFQNNLAILSLVKQQYLPSHAGHVICLLLLMPVRTEEPQHSESICGLDDLGVMWRFGFWMVKGRSAPQLLLLERKEETNINSTFKFKLEPWDQRDRADGSFIEEYSEGLRGSTDTHSRPDRHLTKSDWLISTPDVNPPQIQMN